MLVLVFGVMVLQKVIEFQNKAVNNAESNSIDRHIKIEESAKNLEISALKKEETMQNMDTAALKTDCAYCPEMVKLPDGIWLGKYEVTQGQWRAVMGGNPAYFKKCGDDCPVEQVSWLDVNEYIDKLNEKTKQHYRLPTEEEWFSASEAGKVYQDCGSENLESVAWWYDNVNKMTHSVGGKNPNAWGLYGMCDNVWEWTSSCYKNDCTTRVLRGGLSYIKAASVPSADLIASWPLNHNNTFGFRLARTN